MRKIIIPVFVGIILLMPLIFPNGFAQETETIGKKEALQLEGVTNYEIIAAFVISAVSIFAIIRIFRNLSRKPLKEIILNSKGFPTLSKFQFLLWTLVIAFSYLALQIIIVIGTDYSGDYLLNNVPENLLALMGISVAVPIINANIKEAKKVVKRGNDKFFGTMFYNPEGKLDLARLQMFLWTIIGISIFLYTLFDQILTLSTIDKLFLPDVSPTLLILMGLSQTAYLGSKIAKNGSQKNKPASNSSDVPPNPPES